MSRRLNLELKIFWNNPEKRGRPTFSKRTWVSTEIPRGSCLISYLNQLIMFHFVVSQVAILCYSGPAFWPRTPPLFDGKLETFIKLISKSLTVYQIPYEYVAKFLDMRPLNSCPLPLPSPRSFCANNFISRNYSMFYCLLFEDFKDHRFLEVCSKSLV